MSEQQLWESLRNLSGNTVGLAKNAKALSELVLKLKDRVEKLEKEVKFLKHGGLKVVKDE